MTKGERQNALVRLTGAGGAPLTLVPVFVNPIAASILNRQGAVIIHGAPQYIKKAQQNCNRIDYWYYH